METALQQRVVGAIVLVALGVIFIPALLDGAGYKSRHARSIEVPPKPAFPSMSQWRAAPVTTPLDKPFSDLKQADAARKAKREQAKREQAGPAQTTAQQAPNERPRQSARSASDKNEKANKLKAWMLQVGSFGQREKADKLRDELRAKGYTTHVFEEKVEGKMRYRVRIGPDISRERIKKQRDKLKKQGIDGLIVSHG